MTRKNIKAMVWNLSPRPDVVRAITDSAKLQLKSDNDNPFWMLY